MSSVSSPVSFPDFSGTAAALLVPLTQVLHAFFQALDERRYDRLLAHLTDDCRWLRQSRWLAGKDEVGAALEARPLDQETRHMMTNAHVRAIEGGTVEVDAYMTAYRYPAIGAPGGALPMVARPLRFNLVSTVFRRDPGHDWRIAEQRLVAAFGFGD